MLSEKRAYLELHLAIALWGFTAILGDLIQLSALTLVWWRVLLTSISLLPLVRLASFLREVSWITIRRFALIGILIGLHWVAFYGSIKLSNASVCLVCMATTSFFVSLLEPVILKSPFRWYELMLGLFIIPGMMLVVNSTDSSMNWGIVAGLASAFLAATFTAYNKKFINDTDPTRITFIELTSAWLFLCPILLWQLWGSSRGSDFWPSASDWGYLIVLALFCTTLAQWLALRALKYLSAFATALSVNLEPIYGIAMAFVLLNDREELNLNFYLGGLVILLAVFSYPFLRRRFNKAI